MAEFKSAKEEVANYFYLCPLCSEKAVEAWADWRGRHTASCEVCGAKWHVYISPWTEKMQWAELEKAGTEGGKELLGIQKRPEFWKKMALTNLRQRRKGDERTKEVSREVIKKEVIVKIRCPYCGKLYDETIDICPHCGAGR